ncbi:MAG: site-specific integrase [Kiritimatiellae bacterium]|nr:site-specific integrase [Kiritimatiellia bacterium]
MARKKQRRSQLGTLEKRKNGIYYLRVVVKSIRVPDFKGGWKYRQIKKTWSTGTSDKERAKAFQKDFVIPLQANKDIEKLEGLEAKIRCIKRNVEEEDRKKPALKVVDAMETFLEGEPDMSDATRSVYTHRWCRFVRFVNKKLGGWGVAELREVTPKMAEEFVAELKRTTKGATFNGYLGLFRRLWRTLYKEAKLTCNPWLDYENRELATKPRRNLTMAEIKKVLSSLDGEMKLLFYIGAYTGMRLGDCANLKWSAIDLVANELSVVMWKTKKRHPLPVRIPIHPDLYSLLSAVPTDMRTGYVVPQCAAEFEAKSLSHRIKQVFKKCGIETNEESGSGSGLRSCVVGFHSLRSGFVTMAAEAGIPFPVIQAIVGHSSMKMTERYYRTSKKDLLQCVAAIPSLAGGTTKPRESITLYAEVIDLIKSKMHNGETMDECLTRLLGNSAPAIEAELVCHAEKTDGHVKTSAGMRLAS